MTAAALPRPLAPQRLESDIESACQRIAPTWPLDRYIAVNPHWGRIGQTLEAVDDELALRAGSRLTMPYQYFRERWQAGAIQRSDLQLALNEVSSSATPDDLITAIAGDEPQRPRLPLLSDAHEPQRRRRQQLPWADTISQQISQFCAAYFDQDQSDWRPATGAGLYASWRQALIDDLTLDGHEPALQARAEKLPLHPRATIVAVLSMFDIDDAERVTLLETALLRINGWAAWCAYLRWQARLANADDDHIAQLLAIRLAWELLIDDGARGVGSAWSRWCSNWHSATLAASSNDSGLTGDGHSIRGLWLRAQEIAYQRPLVSALSQPRDPELPMTPTVQAVFCIDVRSEPMRRALETVLPSAQTLGFAGFFGLPVRYTPLGTSASRPQLPGLLAPAMDVVDRSSSSATDALLATRRQQRLAAGDVWDRFERMPGTAFTRIETTGLALAGALLRRSLPRIRAPQQPSSAGLKPYEAQLLRPLLTSGPGATPIERAQLAARILKAMNLGPRFARIVLLVGHGSTSANNPHAASLDCGACCGQTGEANARALAMLLNDADVRAALVAEGVTVPRTTRFIAALHNTTTDQIELFDTDLAPPGSPTDLRALQATLESAGRVARAERCGNGQLSGARLDPRLDADQADKRLLQQLQRRACDWSQTRPEWGLANNAAFIVAPRSRTRGLRLAGRSFLHEYDPQRDVDGSVLEQIMTAPMVVAHWINLQYYASTVDNLRFGCGNKLLHNVVGGRIGVFEGNAGDLRIGLPLQSLHDGERWRHEPLRLSVFIEAPRERITAITARHQVVAQLVGNRWLHLFRIDPLDRHIEHWNQGRWETWLPQASEARAA